MVMIGIYLLFFLVAAFAICFVFAFNTLHRKIERLNLEGDETARQVVKLERKITDLEK